MAELLRGPGRLYRGVAPALLRLLPAHAVLLGAMTATRSTLEEAHDTVSMWGV